MTPIKFAQALKHVIDLAIDFDVHPSEIIEALEAKVDELRGRIDCDAPRRAQPSFGNCEEWNMTTICIRERGSDDA